MSTFVMLELSFATVLLIPLGFSCHKKGQILFFIQFFVFVNMPASVRALTSFVVSGMDSSKVSASVYLLLYLSFSKPGPSSSLLVSHVMEF